MSILIQHHTKYYFANCERSKTSLSLIERYIYQSLINVHQIFMKSNYWLVTLVNNRPVVMEQSYHITLDKTVPFANRQCIPSLQCTAASNQKQETI